MSVTHLVTQSFSNGRATPFQTRFSSCWYTPGYTHNFKWSGNMRLNIHFQSVRRHGNTLVFKKFGHPVTHSFSNGLVTPGYTLVFKWSAHNRLTTRFQMVVPHPVSHSFFKLLIHTRLHTQFQMVRTHPVTQSFSICWYTSVYTLKFKCSEDRRLDTPD